MNKLSRRGSVTAAAVLATAAGSLAWAATSATPASAAAAMHNGPFPTCAAHALNVRVGSAHGNPRSRQVIYRIDFTNNSRYACTLMGYPRDVIAADSGGHRLGVPARQIAGVSLPVVLLEGQTAHSQLAYDPRALAERGCHARPAAFLLADLPDSGQQVRAGFAHPVCSGHVVDLSIGEVQAGA